MGIGEFLEVLTRSHWQNENKVAPKQPQPAPLPAGGGSPQAKQVQHGKGADEFWDTIIQLSAYENTLLKGAAQPTTTRSMVSTLYAVLGEKRKQSLTIFPVVTQDGGRDSWDLAAGDALPRKIAILIAILIDV